MGPVLIAGPALVMGVGVVAGTLSEKATVFRKADIMQGSQRTFDVPIWSLLDPDTEIPEFETEEKEDGENTVKVLTKKGRKDRDEWAENNVPHVRIRRLQGGEFAELEALEQEGIKMKGMPNLQPDGSFNMADLKDMDLEVDYQKMQESSRESMYKCVSYGLSCDGEQWSVPEVRKITPHHAISEIAQAIYSKAQVTQEEADETSQFRADGRGSDSGDVSATGLSVVRNSEDDSGDDGTPATVSSVGDATGESGS